MAALLAPHDHRLCIIVTLPHHFRGDLCGYGYNVDDVYEVVYDDANDDGVIMSHR